jgi:hypothetical protein
MQVLPQQKNKTRTKNSCLLNLKKRIKMGQGRKAIPAALTTPAFSQTTQSGFLFKQIVRIFFQFLVLYI